MATKKTNNYMVDNFLGKEVQIYPGDTYCKFGIVREINDNGVVFECTRSERGEWAVGELRFIAYSAKLSFTRLKKQH